MAALFAVAVALRLYVAFAVGGEAVWDGHYYDFGARRIAAGFGYSDDLTIHGVTVWHPWSHYPVGFSAFLAVFYRSFGSDIRVAWVVCASVGAGLAAATYWLAHRAFGRRGAIVAGLLVALHPGLILYSALVMTEQLAALLTFIAFAGAIACSTPRRRAIAGGLLLGVAALVRPQALLCAPFIGLAALAQIGPHGLRAVAFAQPTALARLKSRVGALAVVALACAMALVPVLPWAARNCRVMDGCALVSTNGGWNLAIGAFPRATGRYETLRSSDGCSDVSGQVKQDRCWFNYGLNQIAASPTRWLKLIPAKLSHTFDHESFAVEYLHEARPDDWPDERRVFARATLTAINGLLIVLAAIGCVAYHVRSKGRLAVGAAIAAVAIMAALLLRREPPTLWPLALIPALLPWIRLKGAPESPIALRLASSLLLTTIATHAVFFGEDRYHIVVTPVMCIFAAAATAGVFRRPAEPQKSA